MVKHLKHCFLPTFKTLPVPFPLPTFPLPTFPLSPTAQPWRWRGVREKSVQCFQTEAEPGSQQIPNQGVNSLSSNNLLHVKRSFTSPRNTCSNLWKLHCPLSGNDMDSAPKPGSQMLNFSNMRGAQQFHFPPVEVFIGVKM